MTGKVHYIPEGYHNVTPYLVVRDLSALMEFMKQSFDAKEREILRFPDGRIMHAEMRIGDSVIMMGEARDPDGALMGMLHLYLMDVDAAYQRALAAGATSLQEPTNQLYGDREAGVRDVFGNQWWLATHIEDVPAEEMQRRLDAEARQQT